MDAIYVSATTFTVSFDRTAEFVEGRRIRAFCGVDGYKYGTVASSSYSTVTTVVLNESVLTSNLTEVLYGVVSSGDTGSLPQHLHDGSGGQGGTISGTGGGSSDVQTLLDLTDTPSVYDEGKYLRSTVSGTEWATVSGAGGSSDVQSFTDLTDTPSTYSGSQGLYLISTGSGLDWTTIIPYQKGKQSMQVEYATASGVYVNPGVIDVSGTMYELDTRTLVPATGLVANNWYYIYTSDASTFTVSSGIPTIDYTKMGWYNGTDRCINAVWIDGTNSVKRFIEQRGLVTWTNEATVRSNSVLTTTWDDVDYYAPVYVRQVQAAFSMPTYGSNGVMYYREKGQSDSIPVLWSNSSGRVDFNTLMVACDENQQGEVRFSVDSTNKGRVYQTGFILPDYIYTGA